MRTTTRIFVRYKMMILESDARSTVEEMYTTSNCVSHVPIQYQAGVTYLIFVVQFRSHQYLGRVRNCSCQLLGSDNKPETRD